MPVPKKKKSKMRTRRRRACHDIMTPPDLGNCNHCGASKQPHRACPECGYYHGRAVVTVVNG